MPKVSFEELLDAGVHFGHLTRKWNPKMKPYIFMERNGIHIIDLQKTQVKMDEAANALRQIAKSGRKILFVATKKQAKDIVKSAAERAGQPYVTERWIGGMLTNVTTVNAQIKKLKDLERRMASGDLEKRYNKLEVQRYQEEIDNLNLKYGGIKELNGRPGAMIVVDTLVDSNAIAEAKNLGIPVIGLVDTNADPSKVDYAIPANDDAIKGIQLMLDYFVSAITEGKNKAE